MSLFRWSPRIAQYPSLGEITPSKWEKESWYVGGSATQYLQTGSNRLGPSKIPERNAVHV
jgi:hypothetical protein